MFLYEPAFVLFWNNYKKVPSLVHMGGACLVSWLTILHFHMQCVSYPAFLHPPHLSVSSLFLLLDVLINVQGYLIMVLICILLMPDDAEYFFMCLFTMYAFSFMKYLVILQLYNHNLLLLNRQKFFTPSRLKYFVTYVV